MSPSIRSLATNFAVLPSLFGWRRVSVGSSWIDARCRRREASPRSSRSGGGISMELDFASMGRIHDVGSDEAWEPMRLSDAAARRARLLAKLGIGPGTVAAIAHGGSPTFFADLFAVWSLGACAACLNPRLTLGELENIVGFVDAKVILAGEGHTLGNDVAGVPVWPKLDDATDSSVPSVVRPIEGGGAEDPALILFTSGTTGNPKGVVHTFGSIAARIKLNRQQIGDATMARTLCLLPTYFGHGLIGNCLTPLFSGADLFLFPDMGVTNAPRLGPTISEKNITFMSSVPTMWKIALKLSQPPARNSLQRIQVGSAPLSADLWRSVQTWAGVEDVVNVYGITETANWVAGASGKDFEPEDGLVGRMWGGKAAVVGQDGVRRDQGEGELVVRTPSIMKGYFLRNDLTDQVVRGGWYHTGDVGCIGADGVIRLTGRQKSEINKAGMKIHPEELDLLLERHPLVAEACAFGIPDEYSGELVGVAFRLADGASIEPFELKAWCGEHIKPDAVPDRWYAVAEIPKTDRGKVNRLTVRDECIAAGDR